MTGGGGREKAVHSGISHGFNPRLTDISLYADAADATHYDHPAMIEALTRLLSPAHALAAREDLMSHGFAGMTGIKQSPRAVMFSAHSNRSRATESTLT